MKNTKTILSKFNEKINVDKKYKSTELINLLSNIYDLHNSLFYHVSNEKLNPFCNCSFFYF